MSDKNLHSVKLKLILKSISVKVIWNYNTNPYW